MGNTLSLCRSSWSVAKGTAAELLVQPGLATGGAAERTAKATEEIARNTKKLVNKASQGGPTFG